MRNASSLTAGGHNERGTELFGIYELNGDRDALEAALARFEVAVDACPANAPELRCYLSNLSGAHLAHFGLTGAAEDLDVAIELGDRAAQLDFGELHTRAATLGNLAVALQTRYEQSESPEDLDRSIAVHRQALVVLPDGHEDRNVYRAGLATGLRMRFTRTRARADIDAAVGVAREAVDTAAPGDPDLPIYLDSLGNCALTRYERYGDLADVDLAVESGRAAVERVPHGRPGRLGFLSNLGNALRERYVCTGSADDLADGIEAARAAVAAAPSDLPVRSALLANFAALLRNRASRTGNLDDFDEAVAAARSATEVAGGPHRETLLAGYAVTLLARFERCGDPADLDSAIAAAGAAVGDTPADHPERASRESDLGTALLERYVHRGEAVDLDDAVWYARAAVRNTSHDHPDLSRYLSNLAYTLRLRWAATDDRVDLDDAVCAGERAVIALVPGRPERRGYLVNLASALASRFERYGVDDDIDAAVEFSRSGVAETPDEHADLPGQWNNLAMTLRVRFERTGRLADLDEAVLLGRRVVEAMPEGHPGRAGHLTNLSGSLRVRFLRTGDRADLDEAVAAGEEAVSALPPTHPERGGFLSNFGNALRARFDETGERGDLEAALEVAAYAVEATPVGKDRSQYLSNLSAVLLSAAEHKSDDPGRLDAAIEAAGEAVAGSPPDHAERNRYLVNYANALITRGARADLELAARLSGEAVRNTPADHPDRSGFLFSAGHAEHALDPESGTPEMWRLAATDPAGPVAIRLRVAWAWGDTAAAVGDAGDAARGFATAVELLPVMSWRGLGRAVREDHLWRWSGLASDACAWALRTGDPRRAVELLEQGRSILWNQIVQTRTDLSEAEATAPELVGRLRELRAALDVPESEQFPEGQRRLAEEWDEILQRIREFDGLESFLAAVPYGKLAAEAAHGPIAVINVSRFGCAAIVLTETEPLVVDLPKLTRAEAVDWANATLQTRLTAEADCTFANSWAAHRALSDMLSWLDEAVVTPVLEELGNIPRIWWCPTGSLTMLPLHAAALDRVVSSYVPTIGALSRARQARIDYAEASALVVAQPETPGQAALAFAAEEARLISWRLPMVTALSGADATASAVLGGLGMHGWAHLSCHGRQDPTDPASSALYLHDRPLTVAEIAGQQFPHGQLAYLSACETSTGGVRLLDEAMHLSAAFQTAGFQHVVATMWTVNDERSAQVADDVYDELTMSGRPDPSDTARALHRAVVKLRDEWPYAPLVWAPYVHSGP